MLIFCHVVCVNLFCVVAVVFFYKPLEHKKLLAMEKANCDDNKQLIIVKLQTHIQQTQQQNLN